LRTSSRTASLVVVFRDATQPLRKIVMYDGVHIQASLAEDFTLPLQGFYKSSALRSAQITQIVASGQKNTRDQMFFDDGANTRACGESIAFDSTRNTGWVRRAWERR
jgi:hypothetical protein